MTQTQRHNFRLFRQRAAGKTKAERRTLIRNTRLMASGPVGMMLFIAAMLTEAMKADDRTQGSAVS